MAKAPYDPLTEEVDYEEVGMSHSLQNRITIERREIIGEVVASPSGDTPMVVAAFEVAGKYLNDEASNGSEARVMFEFEGFTFIAACEKLD